MKRIEKLFAIVAENPPPEDEEGIVAALTAIPGTPFHTPGMQVQYITASEKVLAHFIRNTTEMQRQAPNIKFHVLEFTRAADVTEKYLSDPKRN